MGRSLRPSSLTWGLLNTMKLQHFQTKHITSLSANWHFTLVCCLPFASPYQCSRAGRIALRDEKSAQKELASKPGL